MIYTDNSVKQENKSKAARRLGTLYWRYLLNNEGAINWYEKAIVTKKKLDSAYRDRGRFYTEQKMFNEAWDDFIEAEKYSETASSKLRTLKLQINLIIVESKHNKSVSLIDRSKSLLLKSNIALKNRPYDFELASKNIALAIITDNIPQLIESYHQYFNASSKQGLSLSIVSVKERLSALVGKSTLTKLTSNDYQILVTTLAESRFYEHLQLLDRGRIQDKTKITHYFLYSDFLLQLKQQVNKFYQMVAVKQVDHMKLFELFRDLNKEFANKISWQYDNEFTQETTAIFKSYLEQHFGAHYTLGNTGGTISLHYGHSMIDESRHIEQYGNSIDIRYTSLVLLASNGYQSWFWDGYAAAGGWATAKQIIRVKDEYVPNTKEWEILNNSKKNSEFLQSTKEAEENDAKLANDEQIVFHASVSKRMQLTSLKRLVNQANITGSDMQQQLKFVNYLSQTQLENDIYIHESRHAVDQSIGIIPGKQYPAEMLEYRAKLSELSLGPIPYFALSRMMAANIGDASGHGIANTNIIRLYVEWMKNNPDSIQKLDHNMPMILQIDKLSINQIRIIAKQADPLAETSNMK